MSPEQLTALADEYRALEARTSALVAEAQAIQARQRHVLDLLEHESTRLVPDGIRRCRECGHAFRSKGAEIPQEFLDEAVRMRLEAGKYVAVGICPTCQSAIDCARMGERIDG